MNLYQILYFATTLFITQPLFAQQTDLEKDFKHHMSSAMSESLPVLMKEITHSFLGTPYVAHTLEGNKTERLVCKFNGVDCTTLVESVLALALTTKKNDSWDTYREELTKIRYRNGVIDGYGSRLHYFTDWLYENSRRKVIKDITQQLGGIRLTKPINFITAHANLYPAAKDSEVWQQLKVAEDSINAREYYYIPLYDIKKIEPLLNTGDIIGITSTVDGLDCNHMGIVDKIGNRAYLLHASSVNKKVELTKMPLSEYVALNKKNNGIIVARPLDKQ